MTIAAAARAAAVRLPPRSWLRRRIRERRSRSGMRSADPCRNARSAMPHPAGTSPGVPTRRVSGTRWRCASDGARGTPAASHHHLQPVSVTASSASAGIASRPMPECAFRQSARLAFDMVRASVDVAVSARAGVTPDDAPIAPIAAVAAACRNGRAAPSESRSARQSAATPGARGSLAARRPLRHSLAHRFAARAWVRIRRECRGRGATKVRALAQPRARCPSTRAAPAPAAPTAARAVIGADAGADKSKGDGKRERAVDTAVDADGGAETDRGINVTTSARLAGRGASGAAAVPAGSAQRSIASHASP